MRGNVEHLNDTYLEKQILSPLPDFRRIQVETSVLNKIPFITGKRKIIRHLEFIMLRCHRSIETVTPRKGQLERE